jgi:hypothetical protein
MVSAASAFVVALSRRYDDWLGFWVATRLALVKPEDEEPKERKIGPDFKWLKKKLKERIRESIAFASGMPAIALISFLPLVGPWIFKIATLAWGWYWLGVTTVAKNDHALVDEKTAPPPLLVHGFSTLGPGRWWSAPIRAYGRLWAWLTRSFHSPAAFFERAPAPFLGLALARAILSLPGLYFLAKPIVPVAAGRLCAEVDPLGRFTVDAPARDRIDAVRTDADTLAA